VQIFQSNKSNLLLKTHSRQHVSALQSHHQAFFVTTDPYPTTSTFGIPSVYSDGIFNACTVCCCSSIRYTGSRKKPNAGRQPSARLLTAVLCRGLEKNGMVRAWHGRGMASANQTRPHCVNQMGKTHSKPLVAWHGRGTAWARHAMCESALTLYRRSTGCYILRPSPYRTVNTFHLGYKNQSVYALSGASRCLFSDKYKTHKYSVGRAYNC